MLLPFFLCIAILLGLAFVLRPQSLCSSAWWQNKASRSGTLTKKGPVGVKQISKAVEKSHDPSLVKPIRPDFDYGLQEEKPYRPWSNGPYHVTMGLKKTDLENWIELDKTYLDKYRLKKKLFENHRTQVIRVLPGTNDAVFEALHLLKDVLVRRFPSMFRLRSCQVIENLVTGDIWDIERDAPTWDKHHPLEVMSLLSTEDFFVLQTDPETELTRLTAACTCFPAGFKIEERIGHTLWQIHAGKVPHYEEKLAKSMDRFFLNLPVGTTTSRFNYAIDDSDELFHRHSHHNMTAGDIGGGPKLADLHLRVERQVLQRLPRTGALLFTIRTYVTPITEVTRDHAVARALRANIDSFDDRISRYKNKSLWNETLQKHIAAVLGDGEAQTEVQQEGEIV